MSNTKKHNLKDVCVRSIKTFVQQMISYLITYIGTQAAGLDVFNQDALEQFLLSVGVGQIAAGVCQVWNGVLNPIFDDLTKDNCEDNTEDERNEEDENNEDCEPCEKG